jgi:hypothetical protein
VITISLEVLLEDHFLFCHFMNILKLGSNEPDVILLQTYLDLVVDGDFGPKTKAALIEFQKDNNLLPDGICGQKSWNKLSELYDKSGVTEEDYIKASIEYDIPLATIKAVTEVEASGRGFEKNRRPRCLFEGHILWSRLKKYSVNPETVVDGHTEILYKNWDKSKYNGGEKEWSRLEEAWSIHNKAALESASLGLFQIMGFKYKFCGCRDVFEFYSKSWCLV